MPDTIPLPEMDALYSRLEKKVNVERQSEIDEFLRTHLIFDGKNKDGTPRFKLGVIEKTSKWNWQNQERLARELALESERKNNIRRIRALSKLKRLESDSITSETKNLARKKIEEIEGITSQSFIVRIRGATLPSQVDSIVSEAKASELPQKAKDSIEKVGEFKKETFKEEI